MSSTTAAMTTAASVASGRSSKSPVRKSSAATASTAASSPESCVRAPADALTAVLERLPLTTMPLHRPAARFAPPSATSSRLASIALVCAGAYAFAAPNPSANAMSITPMPPAARPPASAEPDVGQAERRQPAPDRPDVGTSSPNALTAAIPAATATSEPGNARERAGAAR